MYGFGEICMKVSLQIKRLYYSHILSHGPVMQYQRVSILGSIEELALAFGKLFDLGSHRVHLVHICSHFAYLFFKLISPFYLKCSNSGYLYIWGPNLGHAFLV